VLSDLYGPLKVISFSVTYDAHMIKWHLYRVSLLTK